jgi:hypothetical protein
MRALAQATADVNWCSYESGTVALLFLSEDAGRTTSVADGFRQLLGGTLTAA